MSENKRIKDFRKSLGLNQEEFAKSLGIKQGSYSDIERGKVKISTHVLSILVKKYRINPIWLYEGTGSQQIELYGKPEAHSDLSDTQLEYRSLGSVKLVRGGGLNAYLENFDNPLFLNGLENCKLPWLNGSEFRVFEISTYFKSKFFETGDLLIAQRREKILAVEIGRYLLVVGNKWLKTGKLAEHTNEYCFLDNGQPIKIGVTDIRELWEIHSVISSDLDRSVGITDRLANLEKRMKEIQKELNKDD